MYIRKMEDMQMISLKRNRQKGITLVTLSIAIIIMMIITSTLIYNITTGSKVKALNNMYYDITKIKDKIDIYYMNYHTIPIVDTPYENTSHIQSINPNDNEVYFVVDLEALEDMNLNYGQDYKTYQSNPSENLTNLYIINQRSHTIYYVQGIQFDDKMYYTIPEEVTKISDNTLPTIPEINIISGTKSKRGFYVGDVVLNITPGIDKMSGVNRTTYKIIKDGQPSQEMELGEDKTITLNENANYEVIAYTYDNEQNMAESKKLTFSIQEDYLELYFKKGEYWTEATNLYAYLWIQTEEGVDEYKAWPGEKMTLVSGTDDIYSMVIPARYEKGLVVFNKRTSSNTNSGYCYPRRR